MLSSLMQKSFNLNLKILKILGFYEYHKLGIFKKILTVIIYIIIMVMVPLLLFINILIKESDVRFLADNIILLAQWISFAIKFLPFFFKSRQVKHCILYFNNKTFATNSKFSQETILKCYKSCQKNSKVFLYIILISCVSWWFKPFLIWENHKAPLNIWFPSRQEFESFTGSYWILYTFSIFAMLFIGSAGGVIDPLLGGLAYYTSSYLEILNYKLQYAARTNKNHHILSECVKLHYATIKYEVINYYYLIYCLHFRFVKIYEDCFSVVLLSQFFACIFALCFSCFQAGQIENLSFDTATPILYMAVALIQIFFYCYYGQLIFDKVHDNVNLLLFFKNALF